MGGGGWTFRLARRTLFDDRQPAGQESDSLMAHAARSRLWPVVLILGGIALGMAIGSCSAEWGDRPERAIAAPVPDNVARNLGEADDGQVLEAAVGQRFSVTLAYWAEWRVDEIPAFLSHAETLTGPTVDTRATGSDQWQVLVFEVQTPGEGELRLVLGRPWIEGDRMREYRLTVRATDPAAPGP